jgi:hypothetical protein
MGEIWGQSKKEYVKQDINLIIIRYKLQKAIRSRFFSAESAQTSFYYLPGEKALLNQQKSNKIKRPPGSSIFSINGTAESILKRKRNG